MTSVRGTGTAETGSTWAAPRGRVRADVIYLGWQPNPGAASQNAPAAGLDPPAAGLDPPAGPGPPLAPSAPAAPDRVSVDWVVAQHREYRRLSRPSRLGAAASALVAAGAAASWLAGIVAGGVALPVTAAAACSAGWGGRAGGRARQVLRAQLRAEEMRVAAVAEVQRRQVAARHEQHAREMRAWRHRRTAARDRPHWYPVTLPTTVHRVDIAGGTLAGWSALLTMLAAPRLAAGGEVTVLDLTEGGAATDLVAVARQAGITPLVWVLPTDLPHLKLDPQLPPDVLADVLAQTVGAADGPAGRLARGVAAGPADTAGDAALIGGVLQALGRGATMPQLIAGLRALAQIGGPAEHLGPGGLTHAQLATLSNVAGRSTERFAAERAWLIEARLRVLGTLGTSVASVPPSRLKVAWLDRRAAAVGNDVLAAYLVIALTAALRRSPPRPRWQQMICLLGAEKLPGDLLDRLCDAAEIVGAGLVLAYRSIPGHVRERLGRGDAAVGFMRLGNADDARLAAEHIGTEHTFVVSQLTDTVGTAVTDSVGSSYTSTVGTSDSVTGSDSITRTSGRSRSHSRSSAFGPMPMADFTGSASHDLSSSASECDSRSITAGISTGTSWGRSTARAVGGTDSAAITMQRSRESLVEQHELQQLPQSAVLLCYPALGGRRVVLADANPAIMALPTATLAVWPHDAD